MELQRDFPEVKIIAISGGDKKGTMDFLPMSQKLGASVALKKPFGVSDILNAVSSLVTE